MTSFTLQAPAKLNLSLRVLGMRDDGFHQIDTLMVKLRGLADELEFREAEDFLFACDDPSVPGGEGNLVVKAARAFEAAAGIVCKCSISLRKVIPPAAGLGGGSSDAATTLRAWNELHGKPLDDAALHQAAATIGSDVPFFLNPGTARATGRGEILTPADAPPPLSIVLLKPAFQVSTPDAYARWKDAFTLPGVSYDPITLPWGTLVNDLEKPVFGKFLFLAELKNWLNARPEVSAALMSGSGSAMYAILSDPAAAEGLIQSVRERLDPTIWSWTGEIGVKVRG